MLVADWGTTNLRLYLCTDDGTIIRSISNSLGVKQLGQADYERHLLEQIASLEADPKDTLFVCGMAGAKNAWKETPYCNVPIRLASLQEKLTLLPKPFSGYLLPGGTIKLQNGTRDVMRGEEIQAFGALSMLASDDLTLCIPGTHSKWVRIRESAIVRFATFPTGDLFHGLMQTFLASNATTTFSSEGFELGIKTAINSSYGFLNALFSARTRALDGQIQQSEVASYLSGLLIGQELSEAISYWQEAGKVCLVGSDNLCSLYRQALQYFSISYDELSSDLATCYGVAELNQLLQETRQ